MNKSTFSIPILFCLLFIGGLGQTFAQTFDIASGGLPTITGAQGGSVTGSASTTVNLAVTINFGQVSPINTNNIVKVTVPIAIRSLDDYRVTATVTGSTNVNLQAIQRSDIGFGVRNMRTTGALSRTCSNSNHVFYAPYNNDPATSFTIAANGRVAYPSSLANVTAGTTVLSGPVLSWITAGRLTINAWIFDAIFTIVPQFYAPGSASLTITFTISAGPNVTC